MLLCLFPGTFLTSWEMVQRYLADDGIASSGSQTSRFPSPLPSIPWVSQVDGMNCAIPCAPTGDLAFGLKPDSCVSSAASRFGLTSGQVFPASSIRSLYSAGTAMLSAAPTTGSSPAAWTSAATTTAAVAPAPTMAAVEPFKGYPLPFCGSACFPRSDPP